MRVALVELLLLALVMLLDVALVMEAQLVQLLVVLGQVFRPMLLRQ